MRLHRAHDLLDENPLVATAPRDAALSIDVVNPLGVGDLVDLFNIPQLQARANFTHWGVSHWLFSPSDRRTPSRALRAAIGIYVYTIAHTNQALSQLVSAYQQGSGPILGGNVYTERIFLVCHTYNMRGKSLKTNRNLEKCMRIYVLGRRFLPTPLVFFLLAPSLSADTTPPLLLFYILFM